MYGGKSRECNIVNHARDLNIIFVSTSSMSGCFVGLEGLFIRNGFSFLRLWVDVRERTYCSMSVNFPVIIKVPTGPGILLSGVLEANRCIMPALVRILSM